MSTINIWTAEELELLKQNIDAKLNDLIKIFIKAGFDRSYKSIRDKRNRLNKEVTLVANYVKVQKEGSLLFDPSSTITVTPEYGNPHWYLTVDGQKVTGLKEVKLPKPKRELVEYLKPVGGTVLKTPKVFNKFETTLVVPDAHTAPGQDMTRFTALGKYTNIHKPNNIVFMGDFGNMDSLSAWDNGKEASHGKKYKEDIKACRDAIQFFLVELDSTYKPNVYFLGGNHDEGRIEKYIENHPQLRGHMDIAEDLRLSEIGFKYIPYKKYVEIQGTLFTHAVMNAANTPVSGKSVMSIIASLTAKSIVVGHHHRFETMSYYRHGADDVQQVLLCGLFSEHTDDYADGGANAYSRCICLLTHYAPGRFDTNQISIDRLKAEYL